MHMFLDFLADAVSVALICDLLFLSRNTGKTSLVTGEYRGTGATISYIRIKTSHRILIYSFVPSLPYLFSVSSPCIWCPERFYMQVCLTLFLYGPLYSKVDIDPVSRPTCLSTLQLPRYAL